MAKFATHLKKEKDHLRVVGQGSRIPAADLDRELVIVVVGETARADRFSLNGYKKETTRRLKADDVLSFTNVHACGTSTAESVPCMFSLFGERNYYRDSTTVENVLDIFKKTNDVDVLWRDNNSNSKGVAERVPYESFKDRSRNSVCDVECRDIGMLNGLSDFIENSKKKDILVVLHQMGSHGPAYYKRYPKNFEIFKPACHTNELGDCTSLEINNAYDNTIAYTDYFLHEVIRLLKKFDGEFETAMIYVSDHGESLGEGGTYLHGMPKMLAPEEQLHIPLVIWMGQYMKTHVDYGKAVEKRNAPLTHDNLAHTLLGLFEVQSSIYSKEKDIFQ